MREATIFQKKIETALERRDLVRREQAFQYRTNTIAIGQSRLKRPQITEQVMRDGKPGIVPYDGAQLGLRVEGQTVVNTPDVVVPIAQAMAAFAVCIVDQTIKKGDALERGGILVA